MQASKIFSEEKENLGLRPSFGFYGGGQGDGGDDKAGVRGSAPRTPLQHRPEGQARQTPDFVSPEPLHPSAALMGSKITGSVPWD